VDAPVPIPFGGAFQRPKEKPAVSISEDASADLKDLVNSVLAVYGNMAELGPTIPDTLRRKGEAWIQLVQAVVDLDAALMTPTYGNALPLEGSPKPIADWLAHPTRVPKVSRMKYLKDLQAWWSSFMPTWRPFGEYPALSQRGWGPLCRRGPSGFSLLVRGLWWWDSQHGKSGDSADEQFKRLLDDMLWVWRVMLSDQHVSDLQDNYATTGDVTASKPPSVGGKRKRVKSRKALEGDDSNGTGSNLKRRKK
jgi:hypothetical protein